MAGSIVRPTKVEDLVAIRSMIQELADFEKMPNGPKITVETLKRDGGFDSESSEKLFHSFVLEIDNEGGDSKTIIGFIIGFWGYSTWEGKTFFLEDFYVKPEFRGTGHGKKLFTYAIAFAVEHNCSRFDFHVLDWNPAKIFYDKMGAKNLTKLEQWEFYRLNADDMKAVLNSEI